MQDFSTDGSFMQLATYPIEFQLRKHGNYGSATTVEEAVNALTPFELLELIATAIDKTKGTSA